MTLDDEKAFKEAKKCWLCLGELTTDRVRDHDHFTGKYRGAADKSFNLKYAIAKSIPVIFHNLKNFDSHLISQAIDASSFIKVRIIQQSVEKFFFFLT